MFHAGINKVAQFQAFQRDNVSSPIPAYSLAEAQQLTSKKVVVRELITSSEGRGITICNLDDLDIDAPLYTEYIPKKKEFRVHVWDGKVIDVQEKRLKRNENKVKEFKVRNTANGYVFCRTNVVSPADLHSTALAAVAAIQRTQGAVDIIWNEKQDKCFALEVNSRPGMQGATLKSYTNAILEQMK